jgi:VanZ family protein
MPTERLASLVLGVAVMVAILLGSPFALPQGWDQAAHFTAFSALTFCLWHATGGRMALPLLAALVAFGLLDEWRQAYFPGRSSDAKDFLADLCAVLATGALLFTQRKMQCAESSPR